MNFDFDNEKAIYLQLKEKIKIMIVSGKYELGEKLPSVRELAIKARVNPNTLMKAFKELEDEKLIYTERTNGKYVTLDKKLVDNLKKEMAYDIINKYLIDMQNLGLSYSESLDYLKKWEE